jgi:hypothetical protein
LQSGPSKQPQKLGWITLRNGLETVDKEVISIQENIGQKNRGESISNGNKIVYNNI